MRKIDNCTFPNGTLTIESEDVSGQEVLRRNIQVTKSSDSRSEASTRIRNWT